LGNKWAIISQRLGPGRYFRGYLRTDNSVKNHFFSRLRKSLRKLNKVIQDKYKKEIREIKIKVLYKIIEAS
jgi:myb proto-oncogene protein